MKDIYFKCDEYNRRVVPCNEEGSRLLREYASQIVELDGLGRFCCSGIKGHAKPSDEETRSSLWRKDGRNFKVTGIIGVSKIRD